MRVRVQTTPLGMCFRIAGIFLLGAVASLVVEHSDWLAGVRGATKQMSVPIPAPATPTATPPRPSATRAAVAAHPKGTLPSGWTNLGGILIPPPGYNDR